MITTNEIITKLKEVRKEKNLSYTEILELLEKNGDYLSKSTISRVFQDGSENVAFRYEETIRPIAKALLDIETIEEADTTDVQAMKSLLQYKIQRIEELEQQIEKMQSDFDKERIILHEKMSNERDHWSKMFDFFSEQISSKDRRVDTLLEALLTKDIRYDELWNLAISTIGDKGQNNTSK